MGMMGVPGMNRGAIKEGPMSWWQKMTPADKRKTITNFLEWAGGTVGAAAGAGWASVPMAGAGAVAGHDAGELASTALGYPQEHRSGAEELGEQAKTFGLNAAGEGAGRLVPMAARAGKTIAKNLVKTPFTPSPKRVAINAALDAKGIPTTVGMRTDKTLPQLTEAALEHFPTSSQPIRDARQAAYKPWEEQLQAIPAQLHPEPVTGVEAGEALQSGRDANLDALRGYFNPKYEQLSGEIGGGSVIDMVPAKQAALAMLDKLPEEASRFFPQGTWSKISALAHIGDDSAASALGSKASPYDNLLNQLAAGQGAQSYASLPPDGQQLVRQLAERMGVKPPAASEIDPSVFTRMTFDEAKNLRTQLLEAQRTLAKSPTAPAFDRSTIPQMLSAVDQSIEHSLASNPEALRKWRYLSDEYGDAMSKINNPTSLRVQSEKAPEALPQYIGSKPTRLEEADAALSPMYGNEGGNPVDMVRRNQADELINASRTQQPTIDDERLINPRTLERKATGNNTEATQALFGEGPYGQLQQSIEEGKAITAPQALFDNTSRTARMGAAMRTGANLAKGAAVVGAGYKLGKDDSAGERLKTVAEIGAVLAAPRLTAKLFTHPAAAKWLTSSRENVVANPGGPIAGAIGRLFPFVGPKPAQAQQDDLPEGATLVEDDLPPGAVILQ